jgi:hypothetical protein
MICCMLTCTCTHATLSIITCSFAQFQPHNFLFWERDVVRGKVKIKIVNANEINRVITNYV